MTGFFSDTATFGEGEVHETILTSPYDGTPFMARFNPDGTLVWAKNI
jgi:hypothetical protein